MEPSELSRLLLELQELDSRLASLERENSLLPEKLELEKHDSLVEDIKAELGNLKERLSKLERDQHKLDGELEVLSGKLKVEEEKLFSGTIMNPKELSSIQAEILLLRGKCDEMETEDLELMEEIDRLREEISEKSKLLSEAESRGAAARKAYELELGKNMGLASELEKEKEGIREKLDPDILETYDKLLKEKGKLAVVRIEDGRNCGGCHVEFSLTQIDKFQHEKGPFRCDYCRRILVK
ncbi:MAG: hypothetical protein PHO53_01805 [Actinomycetota bacterium]|nr:hypothetical protein [Actinomycetota bacterium]